MSRTILNIPMLLVIIAGGLMSIFLMGVWDPAAKQWCTVAKCGNGHDDKTIEKLNRELKMKKISKVWNLEDNNTMCEVKSWHSLDMNM